jgi:hypothetical protein
VRCGGPLAGFCTADFQGDHRLQARDVASCRDEARPVRAAFQIQGNHPGVIVFRDRRQHIDLVEIGLIAQADDLREAESLAT